MGANTDIEWAHHTFNPWVGCTKVSPACDHCYAEGWAKRAGNPELWQGKRRRTSVAYWRQPVKWNKEAGLWGRRERVFCASLADVFDNQVPTDWRAALWALINETPNLDWLLLTKRPQNIAKMLPPSSMGWPWPNVWLGTTVENQEEADRRIPHLLSIPAKLHFLSCEPLLEPVELARYIERIGWVIAGGESGGKSRPNWTPNVRAIVRRCQKNGVPVFVKQMGSNVQDRNDAGFEGCEPTEWPDMDPLEIEHDVNGYREEYQGAPVRIRLKDRKGGDPAEWPEDLRVRQFPEVA